MVYSQIVFKITNLAKQSYLHEIYFNTTTNKRQENRAKIRLISLLLFFARGYIIGVETKKEEDM